MKFSNNQLSKKELKKIYQSNLNDYENVCKISKELIQEALVKSKIDVLQIDSRVKSFDSFYEKVSRKKCKNPFIEIEDICGIRIICFYSNDLERINKVIRKNFVLKDFSSKTDLYNSNQFGYRSDHYNVSLPKSSELPQLNDLVIEIQSRTTLMHVWAHIQGKLEYKKDDHIPKEFRRKLSQLSALLELADEHFQTLKIEKDKLRTQLSTGTFEFTSSTELNIDTFMSFLKVKFPERKRSYRQAKLLLKGLLDENAGFRELIDCYSNTAVQLANFEEASGLILKQEEALKVMLFLNDSLFSQFLKSDQLIINNRSTLQSIK